MAQWLGALAVLSKDPSLVPSTHVQQLAIACNFSSRGTQHSWTLKAFVLIITHSHPGTHIHITKNPINLKKRKAWVFESHSRPKLRKWF